MADAQIRLITLAPADSDTNFNIRFRASDFVAWIYYDPANATPSSPADLSVGLLDADNSYLLDGINSPTGNTAVASAEGNWYSTRLQGPGGYGGWSLPFKGVGEPDEAGPMADVAKLERYFSRSYLVLDLTGEDAVTSFLGELLTDAMDELRLDSDIDALYAGVSTAKQVRCLIQAEMYIAKALILERTAEAKTLGVQAPLMMEDSDSILEVADRARTRAQETVASLELGEDVESDAPFALPAASCSTFSPSSTENAGFRRNRLADELGDPMLVNSAIPSSVV